jgi:hypothetical protein
MHNYPPRAGRSIDSATASVAAADVGSCEVSKGSLTSGHTSVINSPASPMTLKRGAPRPNGETRYCAVPTALSEMSMRFRRVWLASRWRSTRHVVLERQAVARTKRFWMITPIASRGESGTRFPLPRARDNAARWSAGQLSGFPHTKNIGSMAL